MKLTDYIESNHNGNITRFAKSQGVMPYQVRRWLTRGCEWHQGGIWCKATKQRVSNDK